MAWINIAKPSVGEATKKVSFADAVIDNLAYLKAQAGGSGGGGDLVPNGDFELDTNVDGVPDGWEVTEYTAGAFGLDVATPGQGAKGIKFTSPGASGGGYLQTTDFIPVSPKKFLFLDFLTKSSVAGIHNAVEVRWYSSALEGDYLSTSTVWDSTANPTSWKRFAGVAQPATGALFAKVCITGAKNDNATAGIAYFDAVSVTTPLPCSVPIPGAIAEATESGSGWADHGSVTFLLPNLSASSIARFSVIASLKGGTHNAGGGESPFDVYARMRFRIGSKYGAEAAIISYTYVQEQISWIMQGVTGDTVTMYMQLQIDDGSYASCTGKVDADSIVIEILSP